MGVDELKGYLEEIKDSIRNKTYKPELVRRVGAESPTPWPAPSRRNSSSRPGRPTAGVRNRSTSPWPRASSAQSSADGQRTTAETAADGRPAAEGRHRPGKGRGPDAGERTRNAEKPNFSRKYPRGVLVILNILYLCRLKHTCLCQNRNSK